MGKQRKRYQTLFLGTPKSLQIWWLRDGSSHGEWSLGQLFYNLRIITLLFLSMKNRLSSTIFLGSKITADGDCSHGIKRHLLFERNAVTNLLISRDITLPTKVLLVKAMVFPIVMYGCESWTIKKAEHQRIDAFELWCWRRLLRVLWTARRFNQSILKEISPEYPLEGLLLKLKLQYLATWCKELTPWKRPWG